MFYKSDAEIVKILLDIKDGLDKNFDYVLVIVGDTGVGKSMFLLHLVEAWQRIIGKKVNSKLVEQVNVDKMKWLEKFKELEAYDINAFDEGAYGLGSKQYAETFSKTLEMMFQVIRYKRFLSVIVIPNFFRLNKFFREDRLRGLVYVDKRGQYKFYTRKKIIRLTQLNEGRSVKNMDLVKPFHVGSFPDYKGVLLKAYDVQKNISVNKILDEVIILNTDFNNNKKAKKLNDVIKDRVLELSDGKSGREIALLLSKELKRPISKERVYKILGEV
jgi:hypothetical protein